MYGQVFVPSRCSWYDGTAAGSSIQNHDFCTWNPWSLGLSSETFRPAVLSQHGIFSDKCANSSAYDWPFLGDVPRNGGHTTKLPCDSLQNSPEVSLFTCISVLIGKSEINCRSSWTVGGLQARASLGSHCFDMTKFLLVISTVRLRTTEKMLGAFKIWKWKRFVVYWIFALQIQSFLEKFHLSISLLNKLIVPTGTEISCIFHVCI